jgi:hypothetical protein
VLEKLPLDFVPVLELILRDVEDDVVPLEIVLEDLTLVEFEPDLEMEEELELLLNERV